MTPDNPSGHKPTILIQIFFDYPTPFIQPFFDKIEKMIETYGTDKVHLLVSNAVDQYNSKILEFIEHMSKAKDGKNLLSIKVFDSYEYKSESGLKKKDYTPNIARDKGMKYYQTLENADYTMNIDSYVQITDHMVLNDLINAFEVNQENGVRIIAPLVKQYGASWANFWGALSDDGWYARSQDYLNIVHGEIEGLIKGLGLEDLTENQNKIRWLIGNFETTPLPPSPT